jgi:Protein of unknown function (DUF3300)
MITTRAVAVLCAALLAAQNPYTFAQQPQPAAGAPDQSQTALSQGQLESLVAPVALYPDPILSQVLVASTYPLEIVEAGRWLSQHSNLTGKALADAAAKQPWDASVQALVMLPDVLKRLNQDVTWTSELGNAFLAQQQDVMAAIQSLRQRASESGALKSSSQQTVSTVTENNQPYIVVQPANPEVVYVPQYNPEAVWGPPPAYYPYPPIYYPPVASALSFGAGIALGAIWGGGGWGGWGWGVGWGRGNNVVINNNFIRRNNFNRVNVGNGNNWVHNPAHRAGVPYNNRNVANRFQGAGTRPATRPTVGQTQQNLNNLGQRGAGQQGLARPGQPGQARPGGRGGIPSQGTASRIGPGNAGRGAAGMGQPSQARPAARPGGGMPAQGGANRIGNRSLPAGGGGNRGAFGGMGQGGRVQMNSNRGFASRGGGGGARGGGGGARGGGRRR